jgi:prepilin-type processing-associated H-X9-DG protein
MTIFSRQANTGQKVLQALLGMLCIGFLLAVLWPVTTHDHGSSHSACLSRIKQLTTGTIIYSSDNNDLVPPFYTFDNQEQSFINATRDYVKSQDAYWCPEVKVDPRADMKAMQYAHSASLQKEISDYKTGGRTLRISPVNANAAKVFYLRDIIISSDDDQGATKYQSPHGTRFSVCYLDGHAKSIESLSVADGL